MLNHLIEFIARTHLIILHYPIALITIAAMFESVRLLHLKFTRRSIADHFRPSGGASVMLAFAFLTTIAAGVTGLIYGFDQGASVDLHRILGIATMILILITAIALVIAHRRSTLRSSIVYLALLNITALTVGVTGHLGGELTHGEGFLTEPLKRMIEKPIEPQAQDFNISAESLETYNEIIQPIFDYSCIKCHGSKKQKGDIRLDMLAHVLDADSYILERGAPDASEIIFRVELPPEDEDAMPPLRKSHPLTERQIDLLRGWIESIAP